MVEIVAVSAVWDCKTEWGGGGGGEGSAFCRSMFRYGLDDRLAVSTSPPRMLGSADAGDSVRARRESLRGRREGIRMLLLLAEDEVGALVFSGGFIRNPDRHRPPLLLLVPLSPLESADSVVVVVMSESGLGVARCAGC